MRLRSSAAPVRGVPLAPENCSCVRRICSASSCVNLSPPNEEIAEACCEPAVRLGASSVCVSSTCAALCNASIVAPSSAACTVLQITMLQNAHTSAWLSSAVHHDCSAFLTRTIHAGNTNSSTELFSDLACMVYFPLSAMAACCSSMAMPIAMQCYSYDHATVIHASGMPALAVD